MLDGGGAEDRVDAGNFAGSRDAPGSFALLSLSIDLHLEASLR